MKLWVDSLSDLFAGGSHRLQCVLWEGEGIACAWEGSIPHDPQHRDSSRRHKCWGKLSIIRDPLEWRVWRFVSGTRESLGIIYLVQVKQMTCLNLILINFRSKKVSAHFKKYTSWTLAMQDPNREKLSELEGYNVSLCLHIVYTYQGAFLVNPFMMRIHV